LVVIWSPIVFGELLQPGDPLLDVADLGGAQSHLENGSRTAHPRAFRFAARLQFAQAAHSCGGGRLEAHHRVLHGLPADFRETLDDRRILHPPPGGHPVNPYTLRGAFHSRIGQQRQDESLAEFRPFIAVTPGFGFI
jgi:hypothetical protein